MSKANYSEDVITLVAHANNINVTCTRNILIKSSYHDNYYYAQIEAPAIIIIIA